MSANNKGQLFVVDEAHNVAAYAWSLGTDQVTLSAVPVGGTVLTLPADAQSGDTYAFACSDGSIGTANPVTVTTAAGSGQTLDLIGNPGGAVYVGEFSSATFRFDQSSKNWSVVSSVGLRETAVNSTFVQSLTPQATQGPGASESMQSGSITSITGSVKVTAVVAMEASATGVGLAVTLHRDLAANPAIGPSPVAGSSTDASHQQTVTFVWVDSVGVGTSHTYWITVAATGGNVTLVASTSSMLLENV